MSQHSAGEHMLVDVYHAFGEWAITSANLLVLALTVSYLVLVERSTSCPPPAIRLEDS